MRPSGAAGSWTHGAAREVAATTQGALSDRGALDRHAVRLLSGGNLQRLILAREIEAQPRLLIAVQPTRGLDVGAIESVHRLLLERRAAGAAILLISEELDEILALADRVDVMYEGRIVGSFPDASEADVEHDRPADDRRRPCARGCRRVGPPGAARRDASLRLEPRLSTPRWLSPAATIGCRWSSRWSSARVILALVGGDPIRAYGHIFSAAFGSVGVISDTLVKATPLILTGLACSLAFRMRLWNIGAEGQLLLGAWGAAAVVLFPLLPAGTPGFVLIPAMMLAGALAGAAWAFIPGILRARLGVNEIITTLMLNYIALQWIQYWVFGPWSEGGFQQTKQFPREAWLPRLTDFASVVPGFGGLTIHLGFVFAVVAAGLVWLLLERSRLGFEIRVTGDSPRAARYAGVRMDRTIIVVFVLSGALAGLAGMSEVSGVIHRLQDKLLTRLRLHRDHHRVPREVRAVPGDRGVDPVRGADPRRSRDPAIGRPGDDPGDHPVLPHPRRRRRPLSGADRAAGAGTGG